MPAEYGPAGRRAAALAGPMQRDGKHFGGRGGRGSGAIARGLNSPWPVGHGRLVMSRGARQGYRGNLLSCVVARQFQVNSQFSQIDINHLLNIK